MKFIYYLLLFILPMLSSCAGVRQYNDPIPVHETFSLLSQKVGESRTINIWTPEEYKNSAEAFPVLYMPDGGTKEDFPHIANTLDKLIKAKKIKPIILVGIENTQRRRDLTGFTAVAKDKEIAPVVGGAEQFTAFISEELFAEINKRYRTTNQKGLIGESLAGLFVVEIFLLKPDLFDFYIAFDPSLWWNDKYLLKTADEHLANWATTPKKIWFAGSSATDIHENVAKLADILKAKNIANLNWKYSPERKEKHHTIFRATKEKAIIWTLSQ
jgi:uncharacterized protein